MPVLLFKLTHVPEDEAREVRELLSDNNLDVYETTAGRWQTGVAAIWLRDEQQLEHACALLDDYQAQRTRRARERFDELKVSAQQPGIRQSLIQQPTRWLLCGIIIAVILGLMIFPFVGFLGN